MGARNLIWTIGGALLLGTGAAVAQQPGVPDISPPTVTDLLLGAPAAAQPKGFREFACGTNGGPPSSLIASFADFAQCAVEPGTGLHEVQFRYDDEIELWALANDLQPIAERYAGTRYGSFPAIVSALFDDEGILHAYRVVTDDRGTARERRVAYTMGVFAKAQFAADAWACTDAPLAEGETPVGQNWVKQDCTVTTADGTTARLSVRLLHRPGQSAIDPHTGQVRAGLYESTARLEVFDAGYVAP